MKKKISKSYIKDSLKNLDYRFIKPGHIIHILGYEMYWQKLYNNVGSTGYVWNPSYTIKKIIHVQGRQDGPFNTSFSNKSDMINFLYKHLK